MCETSTRSQAFLKGSFSGSRPARLPRNAASLRSSSPAAPAFLPQAMMGHVETRLCLAGDMSQSHPKCYTPQLALRCNLHNSDLAGSQGMLSFFSGALSKAFARRLFFFVSVKSASSLCLTMTQCDLTPLN